MLKRVLIANRGEIALSIFRACRELGIETVAVYSDVDRHQPVVYFADESICIGGARSTDSYLNMNNIIAAALGTGCDAIHPGYGFLSENADFAALVEQNGLKLIGPSSETIRTMGDKLSARSLMVEHGVPVVPGKNVALDGEASLKETAKEIGYPVLLKASAGGGGKGMRRVYRESELIENWTIARREALASFGDDRIYIEKLVRNPRHIEFQILADRYGKVIHLHERDCSIQRNNQKFLEEAPSTGIKKEVLEKMGQAAIDCARACRYEGAGTVEFIVDEEDNFYFIEMNTRIQVEHPVTEMITGVNLIKEQLRIASGLPLRLSQEEILRDGHAIEVRVNAQNPLNGFAPSCGKVSFYFHPGGVNTRFESGLYQGAEILPFYDSMLGKLIVKGKTRLDAIKKMRRAIEETIIDGITTNLSFQYAILHEPDFLKGKVTTSYFIEHEDELVEEIKRVQKFSQN